MNKETPTSCCKTLLAKRPGITSGIYWLDPDGGSHDNAFRARCDMETDGGGWTLVWSYTFTDYQNFDSSSNAVTPVPKKWREEYNTDVAISTTVPLEENQYDAVDFQLWGKLGKDFLVKSNINNWLACSPIDGSFVLWKTGAVSCQVVKRVVSSCTAAPTHFSIDKGVSGPILEEGKDKYTWRSYYYFDGKTTESWPTHDPCASDSRRPGVQGVDNPRGNIFVR